MRIVVKNAVKRKSGWLYFIDVEGNLRGYDMVARRKKLEKNMDRWECVYCGFKHYSKKRPFKCSCRNGYVKHFRIGDAVHAVSETEDKDGN